MIQCVERIKQNHLMDSIDESRHLDEDESIEEYLFDRSSNQHKHAGWKSCRLFTQSSHL